MKLTFEDWYKTQALPSDEEYAIRLAERAWNAALKTRCQIKSAVAPGECVPDEPSDDESLIACLGDDAAKLMQANPGDEMATTMLVAAIRISQLLSRLRPPNNQPNSDHVAVISAKPDSVHLDSGKLESADAPRLNSSVPADYNEQHERNRRDAEDLEALHMCLDKHGIPRSDAAGAVYSAWGRVLRFVAPSPTDGQILDAAKWTLYPVKPCDENIIAFVRRLESGIGSPTYRPNEQNAVQTEQPSLNRLPDCICDTVAHEPPDTACQDFLAGGDGRCVYCAHEDKCHPGPGATCEIGKGAPMKYTREQARQIRDEKLSAQRQDSDNVITGEQCVSSSGPIGCYRVRCHLGKVCAAIANGAPK